ncbi:TniQ family protein [Streptomyces sp. NBC_00199]|uniref:TniQ family protein n=1 Tax=Streptomyces sp. NBC_00199 TaxID=2975678 RepID=UPI0022519422|nr:TniQ family protein [Streptomyces sp. NBC_00199]MCX5266658.1 TniQ family protein [Streptomyces sp. NBC_00199]
MHPFPRSLAPLPGESLPGLILRLAHRLSISPLHIAQLADDRPHSSGAHVPRRLLLGLDPSAASVFANMTKLSLAEAVELTLASWKERYPPISTSLEERSSRSWNDSWLFVTPRHCPRCLGGDGSPLGQQLGGAWQKAWHLPVVFACLDHRLYLRHECPKCHDSADEADLLIHRANDSVLHPAQCRRRATTPSPVKRITPACGARLDTAQSHSVKVRPTDKLLGFQEHLLSLLAPDRPPGEASRYFTDLRLVTALVSSSWPHARSLIDDGLAARVKRHFRTIHAAGNTSGERNRLLLAPPRDAAVCAALLHASHMLLEAHDLRSTLADLINASSRNGISRNLWARQFTRWESSCSVRMDRAAAPLTRTLGRTSGPHGLSGMFRSDYRPKHIPAFLEPQWFEEHFSHLKDVAPKILRRTAAIRLVRWVAGGSMDEAAEFLGISPSRMQLNPASDARRWARSRQGPAAFEDALHNLAEQLAADTAPIDYHYRRAVLEDWHLSRGEWQGLINRLPPTPGPVQPVLDDRKRQDASIFIWTRITQGEHLFAPRLIEAGKSERVQRAWANRRNTTWFQLTRPDPLPHYAELRRLLIEHAESLAQQIDADAPLPRAQEHLWPPPQSSPDPPPPRNPQIHATRWIRSYYDELDTWSYFELDNESWALRHVDLQGPTLQPVTAAALSEVLGIRDQRDQTAMADYEHKYGILAEGSLDGWQDTQSATEITAAEFERIWASAREALAPDGG